MYERKEPSEYIWIVPLIAAFLLIIAVIAPTAQFNYGGLTWDWWMWNLTVMGGSGYESVSVFITEMDFVIPSIIATIAILLSAVNLFILSITTKKRSLDTKDFKIMSIISAVLSISIMIYYIVAIDMAFYDGLTVDEVPFPAGIHFWDVFNPGFGVILPFISAALSFIGVGLFYYYSKRKRDFVPLKTDTFEEMDTFKETDAFKRTEAIKEQIPVIKSMGDQNFCAECGSKLHAGAKFCTNCGSKS